jgi:hypothetical protein
LLGLCVLRWSYHWGHLLLHSHGIGVGVLLFLSVFVRWPCFSLYFLRFVTLWMFAGFYRYFAVMSPSASAFSADVLGLGIKTVLITNTTRSVEIYPLVDTWANSFDLRTLCWVSRGITCFPYILTCVYPDVNGVQVNGIRVYLIFDSWLILVLLHLTSSDPSRSEVLFRLSLIIVRTHP